jgi:hypothetical protein
MRKENVSVIVFKTLILAVMAVGMITACEPAPPKTDDSIVVQSEPAPEQSESSTESTTSSNEKIAKEVINATVDLTKTVIKTLKVNDSIRVANREQMYAYQIGLPIKDKDDVFEEYGKLENTESVYVLKKARKEYYLIKYEGKTKDELSAGLDDYRKSIPSDLSGGAKVINVMSLCSKREKLMVGESLTKRKENEEIPCLICD